MAELFLDKAKIVIAGFVEQASVSVAKAVDRVVWRQVSSGGYFLENVLQSPCCHVVLCVARQDEWSYGIDWFPNSLFPHQIFLTVFFEFVIDLDKSCSVAFAFSYEDKEGFPVEIKVSTV